MAAGQRPAFSSRASARNPQSSKYSHSAGGGGGFEHRVIGDERLFFALFGGVLFVGELFERGAAEVLQAVEEGGLVFGVGEELVVNRERLDQRRGVALPWA